jgi:hypothetical protein
MVRDSLDLDIGTGGPDFKAEIGPVPIRAFSCNLPRLVGLQTSNFEFYNFEMQAWPRIGLASVQAERIERPALLSSFFCVGIGVYWQSDVTDPGLAC